TIRKAVKKMASIDRMKKDGTFNTLSKKERLQVDRLRAKLEKNLGSIADMTRLPGAIFIVDVMREHIAVKEAQKLNIPIFAMVDTNCDPRPIHYVIPSNDDASKSIDIIMDSVTSAVAEGLAERKADKQAEATEKVSEPEVETAEAPAKEVAPVAEEKVEEAPAAVEAAAEEKETPAKKEKETAKADDLTKIEGIGPKGAEALINAGLDSFKKLAGAKPDAIKEILTEASSRMAHLDPTSWPKQAKMAADGDWDKLKDWQDKAKAGVE
ncbi:MAG: 30S ribosomal protein S2, partial [Eudoraea sp.]|nr:30S ribosomal protein S2 [Eudoraea sp.]